MPFVQKQNRRVRIQFICHYRFGFYLKSYFREESEIVLHTNDPIAPVGYLKFNKLSLSLKTPALDLESRLAGLSLKDSEGYITDNSEESLEYTKIEGKLIL